MRNQPLRVAIHRSDPAVNLTTQVLNGDFSCYIAAFRGVIGELVFDGCMSVLIGMVWYY